MEQIIYRSQLTELGLNKRKIGSSIRRMKKEGLTSVDQLFNEMY